MTSLNLAGNLLLEIGAAMQNLGNQPPDALRLAAMGGGTTGNDEQAFNTRYDVTCDHVNVSGTFTIAVTGTVSVDLLAGYVARVRDVFNFLDAGTCAAANTSNFSVGPRFRYGTLAENGLYELDFTGAAGTLAGFGEFGLAFDTNLFLTEGILIVVSEPSRGLFLLAGAGWLASRRRRF